MKFKTVGLIVAHPDDETLWAGGTLMDHPFWECFIVCLCRASDMHRAPRFHEALRILNAQGIMGDLDDGPDQRPLDELTVEHLVLDLLPTKHFDLIITHNPSGEYTRHIRHEEVGKAIIKLWHAGKIATNHLWTFAYEDGGKKYYPKPIENASIYQKLTTQTWLRKYRLITETYGFEKSSFEAQTTPKAESFWQFSIADDAFQWLNNEGILR